MKRFYTAMTRLGLVLSLLFGVGVSTPFAFVSASPPASFPAREADAEPPLFAFARSLFDSGEYYRAIGEFQRFLFFQAEHPLVSQAQLAIGLAFFCGERWLPASEIFRRVALANPDTPIGQEAVLWMAEARARGGDHPAAVRLYQEVMRQSPDGGLGQRAAYLTGWSQLHQQQWSEARAAFVRVDPGSPYHASAQRLAAARDPPPELPQRSPTVARVFSTVLPGAGQIYAGRTLDGLIGLGLHAALIAGTTGAIWAGLEGAAGIGAFFTWGFYQTQMSNAANSARDFNAQAADRFIGQLAAQERALLHAYARPIPCAP